MDKQMTIHERIDLADSIYKSYSKKARTLRKRAASLNVSAEFYEKEAERNRLNREALLSIAFKPGDPVIVSGSHTGEGEVNGVIIEYSGVYGMAPEPYYNVQAHDKRHFVAQRFLTKRA